MRVSPRVYASFLALVVGLFLLLEGSKFDPTRGALDIVFVVAGAILTVSYFVLLGDHLERKFRDRTITLMPVLFVLGCVMVYQGVTRPVDVVSRILLGVLGAIIAIVSGFLMYRISKR